MIVWLDLPLVLSSCEKSRSKISSRRSWWLHYMRDGGQGSRWQSPSTINSVPCSKSQIQGHRTESNVFNGTEQGGRPASHQVKPQNHKVLRLAVRVLAPSTGWRERSAGSTPRGTLWSEGGEGVRVWASPTAWHSSEELMLGARPTCPKL